ncbi:MAG: riboflavin synthase subunit alpha [candidate division Zixibacteria bacterium RBG_16_53_22]|nr:MAG: riboflavin synthase subunit alpha [candidate division Zixibacteria bacterium RBG_16_53_22]
MFTGIISEIGKIKSLTRQGTNLQIEVEAHKVTPRLDIGASVAINGACQTVVSRGPDYFRVEAIAETLSRTNLDELVRGSLVNLETPLSPADLLHGHIVQGHVDCISRITNITPRDGSTLYTFDYPREYERFLIEKGSVAVDGVSLTIVRVEPSSFQVAVIPHTLENTIFKYRKAGDTVNLEFDIIAKYINQLISRDDKHENRITTEFLKEHGF